MRVFLTLMLALLVTACWKNRVEPNDDRNNPVLPPYSERGAHTLGFLLNGKPWTPWGYNGGTHNLTMDYDPGFNNGIVGIAGYRVIDSANSQHFGLGIRDSLNFKTAPFTIELSQASLYGFRFTYSINCWLSSQDSNTYSHGFITITKHDRSKGIIAGIFEATLYQPGCDTIRITEGRFDMGF